MSESQQEKPITSGAERMRQSRDRARRGVRLVWIEVRETEVAELVRRGLMAGEDSDDPCAVSGALGLLLDGMFEPEA